MLAHEIGLNIHYDLLRSLIVEQRLHRYEDIDLRDQVKNYSYIKIRRQRIWCGRSRGQKPAEN